MHSYHDKSCAPTWDLLPDAVHSSHDMSHALIWDLRLGAGGHGGGHRGAAAQRAARRGLQVAVPQIRAAGAQAGRGAWSGGGGSWGRRCGARAYVRLLLQGFVFLICAWLLERKLGEVPGGGEGVASKMHLCHTDSGLNNGMSTILHDSRVRPQGRSGKVVGLLPAVRCQCSQGCLCLCPPDLTHCLKPAPACRPPCAPQIDRARAIFVHASSLANPRVDHLFWLEWKQFEVAHGNEDTFREMLRIQRWVPPFVLCALRALLMGLLLWL